MSPRRTGRRAVPPARWLQKWSVAAGNFSYKLSVDGFGTPSIFWTTDGVNIQSLGADANLGHIAGGGRQAIRVDFDVNDGAGNKVARFFTAPTWEGPWVELGTTRVAATATTIHSGSAAVLIGDGASVNQVVKFFYAQVRNGQSGVPDTLGGTAVLTYDGNVITSKTQTQIVATPGGNMFKAGTATLTVMHPNEDIWEEHFFTDPGVGQRPVVLDDYPESADGLGFFIEEWTGLDSGHITRPVSTTGHGGQLGTMHAEERVMAFNVIAFARTEKALNYMYSWLEATARRPSAPPAPPAAF